MVVHGNNDARLYVGDNLGSRFSVYGIGAADGNEKHINISERFERFFAQRCFAEVTEVHDRNTFGSNAERNVRSALRPFFRVMERRNAPNKNTFHFIFPRSGNDHGTPRYGIGIGVVGVAMGDQYYIGMEARRREAYFL